jgi:predicted DNA-binding helix-hairpin-helix protein
MGLHYDAAMVASVSAPDTRQKLSILSADAQYDLACACGTNDQDHRRRSTDDRWLYPVSLPNGGKSVLFKTLVSNVCVNDCKYCPLRAGQDVRRCTLSADETVRAFMAYLRAGMVFGLFLSSGVLGNPDRTMEHLIAIARALRRREQFRGYIHLKVIPGASDAAIEEAVSLASAVSLNIETAGEDHFRLLSSGKDYLRDVIRPIQLISRLTAKGSRYRRVKQTTQFVVGASDETDRELVRYSAGLYNKLDLDRVYFSAYQRGLGAPELPGERAEGGKRDLLTREHRLYQADWLMRKYGFAGDEIPFDASGNLELARDPKEVWAERHPEFFPVSVNRADRALLLRVPGLGPVAVARILACRTGGGTLHSIDDLGSAGKRLRKATPYLTF